MWNNASERGRFVGFLLQAKRATYAGRDDEATVAPFVPGSKQLEHRDGDDLYRDIYLGMAYFVGQEVVSYREQRGTEVRRSPTGAPPDSAMSPGPTRARATAASLRSGEPRRSRVTARAYTNVGMQAGLSSEPWGRVQQRTRPLA